MKPSVLTIDEENCSPVNTRPDYLAADTIEQKQQWSLEGLPPPRFSSD